jgi:hypothetical protein
MREAAIMLHAPSAETCRMGQAMRAHGSITEVRHGGGSAGRALRRASRGVDRQVLHTDDLELLGEANIGNVLISHGSVTICDVFTATDVPVHEPSRATAPWRSRKPYHPPPQKAHHDESACPYRLLPDLLGVAGADAYGEQRYPQEREGGEKNGALLRAVPHRVP